MANPSKRSQAKPKPKSSSSRTRKGTTITITPSPSTSSPASASKPKQQQQRQSQSTSSKAKKTNQSTGKTQPSPIIESTSSSSSSSSSSDGYFDDSVQLSRNKASNTKTGTKARQAPSASANPTTSTNSATTSKQPTNEIAIPLQNVTENSITFDVLQRNALIPGVPPQIPPSTSRNSVILDTFGVNSLSARYFQNPYQRIGNVIPMYPKPSNQYAADIEESFTKPRVTFTKQEGQEQKPTSSSSKAKKQEPIYNAPTPALFETDAAKSFNPIPSSQASQSMKSSESATEQEEPLGTSYSRPVFGAFIEKIVAGRYNANNSKVVEANAKWNSQQFNSVQEYLQSKYLPPNNKQSTSNNKQQVYNETEEKNQSTMANNKSKPLIVKTGSKTKTPSNNNNDDNNTIEPQPGTSKSFGINAPAPKEQVVVLNDQIIKKKEPPTVHPKRVGSWMKQVPAVSNSEIHRKIHGRLTPEEHAMFYKKWELARHSRKVAAKVAHQEEKPQEITEAAVKEAIRQTTQDKEWRGFDKVMETSDSQTTYHYCSDCHRFVRLSDIENHKEICTKTSALACFETLPPSILKPDKEKVEDSTSNVSNGPIAPPCPVYPESDVRLRKRVSFKEDNLVETRFYYVSKENLRKRVNQS